MYNHINEFLSNDHKLHPNQHGFRKRHSYQTQLLETIHDWAKALDSSSSTHVVFTDFSKAFDSVPHCKLLLLLECMGVGGQLLQWIQSFISGQRQRVVVEHSCSARVDYHNIRCTTGIYSWSFIVHNIH